MSKANKKFEFTGFPAPGTDKVTDKKGDDEDAEEESSDDESFEAMPMTKDMIAKVLSMKKEQLDMDIVEAKYKVERLALEKKYEEMRLPLYDIRSKIIRGEIVPEVSEEELAESGIVVEEGEDVTGIPQFWLTCLNNCSSIRFMIQEDDIPLLEKLTDIKCEYDDDYSTFTLSFYFAENEYFNNKILEKKYGVQPDLLDDKSPSLRLNEGTEIDWKAGKNLCVTEIKKKQKAKAGKHKGQVRVVVEKQPKRSFFNYFSKPKGADSDDEDDDEEEDEDDEEYGPLRLDMEEDYDIGHTIRTCIIPQSILWFTGEAESDDDDEEEDDEEEDDNDDEEDDDDDEEEEEEEGPKMKSKGKKGKRKGKGGGAAGAAVKKAKEKAKEEEQQEQQEQVERKTKRNVNKTRFFDIDL